MTTTKEKIEIMQFYEDGGTILYSLIDYDIWKVLTEIHPDFDWSTYEYKIRQDKLFEVTIDSSYTVNFKNNAELKRFQNSNRIIKFIEVE